MRGYSGLKNRIDDGSCKGSWVRGMHGKNELYCIDTGVNSYLDFYPVDDQPLSDRGSAQKVGNRKGRFLTSNLARKPK
jgi:hypothetical protein